MAGLKKAEGRAGSSMCGHVRKDESGGRRGPSRTWAAKHGARWGRASEGSGHVPAQERTDAARTGQGQAAMHPIITMTGATAMCSAIQDDVTALARAGSSGTADSGAAGLGWPQQQGDKRSSAMRGQCST